MRFAWKLYWISSLILHILFVVRMRQVIFPCKNWELNRHVPFSKQVLVLVTSARFSIDVDVVLPQLPTYPTWRRSLKTLKIEDAQHELKTRGCRWMWICGALCTSFLLHLQEALRSDVDWWGSRGGPRSARPSPLSIPALRGLRGLRVYGYGDTTPTDFKSCCGPIMNTRTLTGLRVLKSSRSKWFSHIDTVIWLIPDSIFDVSFFKSFTNHFLTYFLLWLVVFWRLICPLTDEQTHSHTLSFRGMTSLRLFHTSLLFLKTYTDSFFQVLPKPPSFLFYFATSQTFLSWLSVWRVNQTGACHVECQLLLSSLATSLPWTWNATLMMDCLGSKLLLLCFLQAVKRSWKLF